MSLCTKCNEFYGNEITKLCSVCSGVRPGIPPIIEEYDTLEELHKYMSNKLSMFDYVVLSDQQFDMIVMTKLNENVPPKEWYMLLNGLTQEFPHILLTADQVKKLINAKTDHKYVNIIYRRCFEPWDADVKNPVGNCYWRNFGEMKKPKTLIDLHKLFDRMFMEPPFKSGINLGDCPICFEAMNIDNTWSTTCCHNGVHTECLIKCKDCPLCRGKYFKTKEVEENTGDNNVIYISLDDDDVFQEFIEQHNLEDVFYEIVRDIGVPLMNADNSDESNIEDESNNDVN